MEKNKKYVRRSYFPHQYEKEEEFLTKMAGEGWHFVKLHYGLPSKYEFDKGEPIDYVYQLDYVNKEEDTENYHSLFADAGWEEVFSWNGLYDANGIISDGYAPGSKDDRIYTDTESKYRMYDKLWKKYGLFFLIMFTLEINMFCTVIEDFSEAEFPSPDGFLQLFFCALFAFFEIWYIYMIVGIFIKKNQIKRELDKRI